MKDGIRNWTGARGPLIVLEVVLLLGTLWLLIWQPLGEGVSLILSLTLAMLFIGLFPAMLKGGRVAEVERETLQRRFGDKDDNKFR